MSLLGVNWIYAGFGAIHLAVITLLVPKIVLQRRESGATLAWIFAIIFLPVLGVAAFWLLGATRIRIMRRRRRRAEQHLAPSLSHFLSQQQISKKEEPVAAALYALAMRLDECGPQPGCLARLYRDGALAYDELEQAIDAAVHHIHLSYYIWEPDRTGVRFLASLIRAARRGVEVRLLIDDVGCHRTPSRFFIPLEKAGGRVVRFLPLNPLSRQMTLNNRNHRKITVVDGRVGFTGSMNIGDVYAGLAEPWSDLHVRITGRVVFELQGVFCQDWFHAAGEDLASREYFPAIDCDGDVCAHFLASGPGDEKWRAIHMLLFSAIGLARRRVWIETPYFVPDESIILALQAAALRGVDVRLLLPGRSDHPLVLHAGHSLYNELLDCGVRIFEMDGKIAHAKTAVIDQIVSTTGSANMDQRSFRLNFEGNLVFFGKKVALEFERDFEQICQQAREITPADRDQITRRQRLLEGFTRILSPLL